MKNEKYGDKKYVTAYTLQHQQSTCTCMYSIYNNIALCYWPECLNKLLNIQLTKGRKCTIYILALPVRWVLYKQYSTVHVITGSQISSSIHFHPPQVCCIEEYNDQIQQRKKNTAYGDWIVINHVTDQPTVQI